MKKYLIILRDGYGVPVHQAVSIAATAENIAEVCIPWIRSSAEEHDIAIAEMWETNNARLAFIYYRNNNDEWGVAEEYQEIMSY